MSESSSIPAEGSRPASFAHVYAGRFKELNSDMNTVFYFKF